MSSNLFEKAKKFSDYLGFYIRAVVFFTLSRLFFGAAEGTVNGIEMASPLNDDTPLFLSMGVICLGFGLTMWIWISLASTDYALSYMSESLARWAAILVGLVITLITIVFLLILNFGIQAYVNYELG